MCTLVSIFKKISWCWLSWISHVSHFTTLFCPLEGFSLMVCKTLYFVCFQSSGLSESYVRIFHFHSLLIYWLILSLVRMWKDEGCCDLKLTQVSCFSFCSLYTYSKILLLECRADFWFHMEFINGAWSICEVGNLYEFIVSCKV